MCWSPFLWKMVADLGLMPWPRGITLALALLKLLAERAVSSHLFVTGTGELPGPPAMQVSLWVQRWQSKLSAWLHLTLSQHLLRLYRPDGLSGLFLSYRSYF